jgi:hypothetical protein
MIENRVLPFSHHTFEQVCYFQGEARGSARQHWRPDMFYLKSATKWLLWKQYLADFYNSQPMLSGKTDKQNADWLACPGRGWLAEKPGSRAACIPTAMVKKILLFND